MPSAVVIIIGNEILNGKFRDENSPWLASRCRELGIDLLRIHVIPDDIAVIAETVRNASRDAGYVFTTGGVGPTHDDMTMAGVAAAFGVELVRHPELERTLRAKMGERVTPAALRMAEVPDGAELWSNEGMRFPQVVVRNVLVFPGVPRLLRMKFDDIADRLGGGRIVHADRLVTTAAETDIAATLGDAQNRYPTVDIGSYPQFDEKPYTVTVTLDSRDRAALEACGAELRRLLADGLVSPGA